MNSQRNTQHIQNTKICSVVFRKFKDIYFFIHSKETIFVAYFLNFSTLSVPKMLILSFFWDWNGKMQLLTMFLRCFNGIYFLKCKYFLLFDSVCSQGNRNIRLFYVLLKFRLHWRQMVGIFILLLCRLYHSQIMSLLNICHFKQKYISVISLKIYFTFIIFMYKITNIYIVWCVNCL